MAPCFGRSCTPAFASCASLRLHWHWKFSHPTVHTHYPRKDNCTERTGPVWPVEHDSAPGMAPRYGQRCDADDSGSDGNEPVFTAISNPVIFSKVSRQAATRNPVTPPTTEPSPRCRAQVRCPVCNMTCFSLMLHVREIRVYGLGSSIILRDGFRERPYHVGQKARVSGCFRRSYTLLTSCRP